MKKFLGFAFLAILLFSMGCAGSSPYMRPAEPIIGPSPDKVLVYFVRPSGFGFAINFQIWENYDLIGLSQAKSYFAYECDPGKHLFIGRAENKVAVEADLEAGKSYYILTEPRMGGWRARMAFIPVTRDSKYWAQTETYKTSLNCITAKPEVIAKWKSERGEKDRKMMDETKAFLQTPKGQKYIVKLNKEDGK